MPKISKSKHHVKQYVNRKRDPSKKSLSRSSRFKSSRTTGLFNSLLMKARESQHGTDAWGIICSDGSAAAWPCDTPGTEHWDPDGEYEQLGDVLCYHWSRNCNRMSARKGGSIDKSLIDVFQSTPAADHSVEDTSWPCRGTMDGSYGSDCSMLQTLNADGSYDCSCNSNCNGCECWASSNTCQGYNCCYGEGMGCNASGTCTHHEQKIDYSQLTRPWMARKGGSM